MEAFQKKILEISLLFFIFAPPSRVCLAHCRLTLCLSFLFLICVFSFRFAALIADAESAMTASADRLVELDTMIAEAQANRTDEHTTIAEILERHPDIAAEIEEEIKEDKWFAQ